MLYDEFIEGTGCRDTEYNYKVYKDLEVMYMNSDTLTKADIYEYGKKLVDNSLTEKQIAWNKEIDEQIERLQAQVEYYKGEVVYYKNCIELWKGYAEEKEYRKQLRRVKNELTFWRNQIRTIKTCKYV